MSHATREVGALSLEQKRALAARLLQERGQTRHGPIPLVHHLIERQTALTPEAVAVSQGGHELTYCELNLRADRLATRLRALGVGPESLVGVCLSRSPQIIVGLLGVLKAGGAYVPLDPDFPESRLSYMVADAQVAILLTERPLCDRLPHSESARVLCLDELAEEPDDKEYATRPPVDMTAENLAYVIYTSGSTGRPKGVQITHDALMKFLLAMRCILKPTEADTLLAVTTLSFDIAALELFLPLIVGARVELVERADAMDGARLARRLDDPRITFLQATPATWRLLLDAGWSGSPTLTMLCGGEALPRALADRLLVRGKALWNLYGPTETTIWSAVGKVEPGNDVVAIGRPIAATQTYVLDPRMRPVPVGVTGELYIGGAGVARGYRNRPELTAEWFLPDPFGRQPGGRLYRTGDLARWLAEGTLECLGRVDHQVKVRGFRVEPGEIEAALLRHPSVRTAAVVARTDATGEQGLIAYLVARTGEGPEPDPAELRRWLRATLPDYLVPSAFAWLDELPLTPNGKIDRNALPDPDTAGSTARDDYVPPRTPIEKAVVELWAELLRRDRVGIFDNFFELGGHSLFAVQVQARLRQVFGVEPSLRDFLEQPTAAHLARMIAQALTDGAGVHLPPIERARRDEPLPASPAQGRLWLLHQLDPGSASYNMPTAVRIVGALDVPALERALNEVVRRHESLRTTFDAVDGVPRQVITSSLSLSLSVVDLRQLPGDRREVEARRQLDEEAGRPFDLMQGPLLRARLLRLGDDEHIAHITIHHIVSDGWSIGVLIRELSVLYDAFHNDQPSPLPELTVQYADYAAWQHAWLEGEPLASQLEYWKQQLRALPSLELPIDRPRQTPASRRGGLRSLTLSGALLEQVKSLAHQERATLFMTLLAAFQVLLHRYTGQDDIAVGSPVAGRTVTALEELIGLFINSLVIRVDLSGNPSFRSLLGRVRGTALDAYAHQDVPFDRLVGELHPDRASGSSPLFQVFFALQNQPAPSLRSPGIEFTPIETAGGSAKFELSLYVTETQDGLLAAIEYDADLFDAARIDRMLRHYQVLIESIVAQPDESIGTLSMLSAEERRMFIRENQPSPEELVSNLDRLGGEELDALLSDLTREGLTLDD